MLNHLTQVQMPRNGTTQTRAFNYTNGTTVGVLLLSATNPENGTVTYTYDTYQRLATKTDAKGQVFTYTYDGMNRLTQLSVGGTVLRTYVYDSNPDNPSYSQNVAGRLAEIKYPAISYLDSGNNLVDTNQFTDMFSYTAPGAVAGKLLQVNKTHTYNVNFQPQKAVGSLSVSYNYNSEGKLTGVAYPTDINNNTPSFGYSYDQMMRLIGATDQNNNSIVSGVQYNAANQLTNITYYSEVETRAYNSLMQLTNITTSLSGTQQLNVTYNYPGGSNNGKISSTSDAISGETVTYQYDSLNRLISASGSGWTQTQAYDGFGNLTGRTGTGSAQGTTISTPVNAATNQPSGYSYDNNGNLISTGYTYDAENRIQFAVAGNDQYFYDGQNKRIWQANCTSGNCLSGFVLASEIVNMYGADGKMLASYTPSVPWNNTQTQLTVSFTVAAERAYFGGKLVAQMSNGTMTAAVQDRLGSVGKYYPYGEDRSGQTGSDTVRFATYTRDSATGNDYADQRYYSSALGRFMTADPYAASGGPASPTSWNRYAYTRGDPANSMDRTGLLNTPPLGDDDDDDGGGNSCVAADGLTPLPGPGCQTAGSPSPSIGTATPPACWQVTTKIELTLTNLGNDILGIVGAQDKDITAADMIALNTTIATDISNEMQEEQSNPLAFYKGGHFSLDLNLGSVKTDFVGDTAAYEDFLNLFDPQNLFGKRNGRRYPNPVPTTDPTHKYYLHDHDNNGTLDFHFDQYNPYSSFPISTLQHFGIDVFYGGLGMPCLDPAWKH